MAVRSFPFKSFDPMLEKTASFQKDGGPTVLFSVVSRQNTVLREMGVVRLLGGRICRISFQDTIGEMTVPGGKPAVNGAKRW